MEYLFEMLNLGWLGTPVWVWGTFAAIIMLLLALDLGVLNRVDHEIGVRESLILSAGYVGVASLFGTWVWWLRGEASGTDFFTGYLIEKSLSMDNVFVIALVFSFLSIPRRLQHRVLFWGILGAIVLRAGMIGLGVVAINAFGGVLYAFGAFLVFTGIRMWRHADVPPDLAGSPLLGFLRRHLRVTAHADTPGFTVVRPHPVTGKPVRWVTPLFLALCLIEFFDLVFAVDSVPAIFAVTSDPFIVYTSNIFAILGLRALYFALAALIHRFDYLKYALALILIFVGGKILAVGLLGKTPSWVSLVVTVSLLIGGVVVSLWKTRANGPQRATSGAGAVD